MWVEFHSVLTEGKILEKLMHEIFYIWDGYLEYVYSKWSKIHLFLK